jgi:hypothetical protein
MFGELVSSSQEAFTLMLYKNGYKHWLWMQNESGTSDTSTGGFDGASNGLEYLYTARTRDLTSINGGRLRSGMLKYNELYIKAKEDRLRVQAGLQGALDRKKQAETKIKM